MFVHILDLVRRIERSFAAARQVVAVLDREGLSRGRRITRALAAELLKEVLASPFDEE